MMAKGAFASLFDARQTIVVITDIFRYEFHPLFAGDGNGGRLFVVDGNGGRLFVVDGDGGRLLIVDGNGGRHLMFTVRMGNFPGTQAGRLAGIGSRGHAHEEGYAKRVIGYL